MLNDCVAALLGARRPVIAVLEFDSQNEARNSRLAVPHFTYQLLVLVSDSEHGPDFNRMLY